MLRENTLLFACKHNKNEETVLFNERQQYNGTLVHTTQQQQKQNLIGNNFCIRNVAMTKIISYMEYIYFFYLHLIVLCFSSYLLLFYHDYYKKIRRGGKIYEIFTIFFLLSCLKTQFYFCYSIENRIQLELVFFSFSIYFVGISWY